MSWAAFVEYLVGELGRVEIRYRTLGTEIIIQPYLRTISYHIYVKDDPDHDILVDISFEYLTHMSKSARVEVFDRLLDHAQRLGG